MNQPGCDGRNICTTAYMHDMCAGKCPLLLLLFLLHLAGPPAAAAAAADAAAFVARIRTFLWGRRANISMSSISCPLVICCSFLARHFSLFPSLRCFCRFLVLERPF